MPALRAGAAVLLSLRTLPDLLDLDSSALTAPLTNLGLTLQLLLALSLLSPPLHAHAHYLSHILTRVYTVLVALASKFILPDAPPILAPNSFFKLLRYPTAPPGFSSVRSNTYILTESFPILTCLGALPHPKTIARS